jgi:hypothetical protein
VEGELADKRGDGLVVSEGRSRAAPEPARKPSPGTAGELLAADSKLKRLPRVASQHQHIDDFAR